MDTALLFKIYKIMYMIQTLHNIMPYTEIQFLLINFNDLEINFILFLLQLLLIEIIE